jgi:hypothetical protein
VLHNSLGNLLLGGVQHHAGQLKDKASVNGFGRHGSGLSHQRRLLRRASDPSVLPHLGNADALPAQGHRHKGGKKEGGKKSKEKINGKGEFCLRVRQTRCGLT